MLNVDSHAEKDSNPRYSGVFPSFYSFKILTITATRLYSIEQWLLYSQDDLDVIYFVMEGQFMQDNHGEKTGT